MDILEKTVRTFGHEDPRTITIFGLFAYGHTDLAEQVFEALSYDKDDTCDEGDEPADLEMGFDPYSGCYDFDC